MPGENTNLPIDNPDQFFATSVLHPSHTFVHFAISIRSTSGNTFSLIQHSRVPSSRKEIVRKALYTEYNLNARIRVIRVIRAWTLVRRDLSWGTRRSRWWWRRSHCGRSILLCPSHESALSVELSLPLWAANLVIRIAGTSACPPPAILHLQTGNCRHLLLSSIKCYVNKHFYAFTFNNWKNFIFSFLLSFSLSSLLSFIFRKEFFNLIIRVLNLHFSKCRYIYLQIYIPFSLFLFNFF